MPEKARVAVVEDDPSWRDLIVTIVGEEGHSVIAVAKNREEAELLIDQIKSSELVIDAVVLDGSLLGDNSPDGQELSVSFRNLNIPVIGTSLRESPWADFDLDKYCLLEDLGPVLANL